MVAATKRPAKHSYGSFLPKRLHRMVYRGLFCYASCVETIQIMQGLRVLDILYEF